MLQRSVQVCLEIASELSALCAGKSIPFGFNIESVAIKNDEIEASIFMVNRIAEILDKHSVRKLAVPVLTEKSRDVEEDVLAASPDVYNKRK